MEISTYFNKELVCFLDVSKKQEALGRLVQHAAVHLKLENADQLLKAVTDRENLVSTGVGLGVAVPHAKLACFNSFFICVGIAKKGINWNSIDLSPVRIIFLIGGPDDKQTEYLRILSALTARIRDDELRKQLVHANSAEEVVALFAQPPHRLG